MGKRHDTLVFIPAWDERGNLPDMPAEPRREIPSGTLITAELIRRRRK
jgi:hypothetical protein